MLYLTLLLPVLLVGIDQLLKWWAYNQLRLIGSIELIPGIFHLTYVENRGAAWGMFAGSKWFLLALPVVIIIAAVAFLIWKKIKSGPILWTTCLIIGGGIGNLIDRFARGFVVDYLEAAFIDFPVFNFADCCICIGCFWLVAYIFWCDFKESRAKKTSVDETEAKDDGEAI